MPLFLYSTLTISFSILFSLPALTVACVFLELDRRWGTHFFDIAVRRRSLAVAAVVLVLRPSVGLRGVPSRHRDGFDDASRSSRRRPIVGYPYIAISTVLTGVVGFGVWVHHMFAVGMSQMAMSFFSAASMTISIFSAVQVFAWLATVWKGRPVPPRPVTSPWASSRCWSLAD